MTSFQDDASGQTSEHVPDPDGAVTGAVTANGSAEPGSQGRCDADRHHASPQGNRRRNEPTQAEQLLALLQDVELIHSPDNTAYATFRVEGVLRTAKVRDTPFTRYMLRTFYQATGRTPSSQALQDVRELLAARAQFDGNTIEVHVRVAEHDGRIYIDLGDETGRAVEVGADGWDVVEDVPVKFLRRSGLQPLSHPERGGDLGLLRDHVRVGDEDFALLLGWVVQALRPRGPYPLLQFGGEQGSGKTTAVRIIRQLVDPHVAGLRSAPRKEREFFIAASRSWMLTYDNLSSLPVWLSDALCRLATGGGYATRRLYTDDEEMFFRCQRPVILNGIASVADRNDLADRTISIELQRIPDGERRTEEELWAAFEMNRAAIFGALLDALSAALRRLPSVQLDEHPRMADFARFVHAAEEAFPLDSGTFMNAYLGSRMRADELFVENDTVASAIVKIIEKQGSWTGKTCELVEDLRAYLPNPERPPRDYPANYQQMARHLKRILPALRAVGIVKVDDPPERSRAFTLRKIEDV